MPEGQADLPQSALPVPAAPAVQVTPSEVGILTGPDAPAEQSMPVEQSTSAEPIAIAGQAPPARQRAAADQPAAKRYVPIDESAEIDPRAAVARFFEAFANGDAGRMAACYHPMASYSNPVFPDLRGSWPGAMWKLALARAEQLQVQWDIAYADARKAQVVWRASWRERGRTRRIEAAATMALWDGDIVRHVDEFRFARWAAQAVGAPALLLAWLPVFQRTVQQRARAALDRFASDQSSSPS